MRFGIVGFSFMALCAGCAFEPQEVTVRPVHRPIAAETAKTEYKTSVPARLTVTDMREDKTLGYRGKPGNDHAPVTVHPSVVDAVEREIKAGLEEQGISVTEAKVGKKKSPVLRVELRKLSYENNYDSIWRIALNVDTVLHAKVENVKPAFERDYTMHTTQRFYRAPTKEVNQKYIDQSLSDTIDKLLNDQELIAKLRQ